MFTKFVGKAIRKTLIGRLGLPSSSKDIQRYHIKDETTNLGARKATVKAKEATIEAKEKPKKGESISKTRNSQTRLEKVQEIRRESAQGEREEVEDTRSRD